MFILVRWYVRRSAEPNGRKTHAFRACGDNFICPLSKGMMLPVSRCNTWAKVLGSYDRNNTPSGGYDSY